MKIKDAKDGIRRAIETRGQYSHNICSCILRSVARKYGNTRANKLIDEFELKELYGIEKEKET